MGSIEEIKKAAMENLKSSLTVTQTLTASSKSAGEFILHRMNDVLGAIVESNFGERSLVQVGALYEGIGKAQPQMVNDPDNLAMINFSRTFAVVLEEAIRTKDHQGGGGNNNNSNNNSTPTSGGNKINNNKDSRLKPLSPANGPLLPLSRALAAPIRTPSPNNKTYFGTIPPKNRATDFEFKSIPDGVESKEFPLKSTPLVCFHGVKSVLAMQHMSPIAIDGKVYTSVDHYYQIEKCKQLVGKDCEALIASVRKEEKEPVPQKSNPTWVINYSQVAKQFIIKNDKWSAVEQWRRVAGVAVTFKAMRAKATQCPELRKFLHSSANKIIVQTYAGDAIFGSGCDSAAVYKWKEELASKEAKLKIPLAPLMDAQTISMAPQIGLGRNLLGLIHMQLADEILKSPTGAELPKKEEEEIIKSPTGAELPKNEEEEEIQSSAESVITVD